MTIEELARLVEAMRSKQREYFSTRSGTVLNECRDLERRADKATKEVLHPEPPSLFGDLP